MKPETISTRPVGITLTAHNHPNSVMPEITETVLKLFVSLHNLITLYANIWLLVITGGPCGGKSSGMSCVKDGLEKRGFKVFIVPEVATWLFETGIGIGPDGIPVNLFQKLNLLKMLMDETVVIEAAIEYAKKGHKVVILFDRGTMDGGAYVKTHSEYDRIIKELGKDFTPLELGVNRYHAVFHLRTAAIGAPQFYTTANNKVRQESEEDLVFPAMIDQLTLDSWQRSNIAHIRVIDNSTGFEEKKRRLLAEICQVLGIPKPLEIERKFLIKPVDFSKIPGLVTRTEIEQTYLDNNVPDEEVRVRCRGTDEYGFSYTHTMKRSISFGVRSEVERLISKHEYEAALETRKPELRTIRKSRHCFFFKDVLFEVDDYDWGNGHKPANFESGNEQILEVESLSMSAEIEMPDFIEVICEVTGKPEFSNKSFAELI